MHITNI